MKAFKLTDKNGQTKGGMQWGEGVTHEAVGFDEELCSDGWIHFYTDLLVGVFMNPAHADFKEALAWECETAGDLHEPLKSGCKRLTTTRQIPLPEVTTTQRVAFAILCALEIHTEEGFVSWAKDWLSGEDRTKDSAANAVYAVYAAYAAYSINAAYAANATNATNAVYAAYAAANAADCAAHSKSSIDFVAIAREAMKY